MMPNMMNPDSPVVLSLLHKLQDEYSRSSLEPDIKFLQSMAAMIVGDAYKGCMDIKYIDKITEKRGGVAAKKLHDEVVKQWGKRQ